MSWASRLYETYENCIANVHADVRMTPIAHMNANAQIEIMLNSDGTLVSISEIPKKQGVTLIPVTEASAGRSSGIAPHPLCDTLSYIGGDFSLFCTEGNKKKSAGKKYSCYMNNLKIWVDSEYTHPKIRSIYVYLSKKHLISDLIQAGLIVTDSNHPFEKGKIGGQPYEKALVRFQVLEGNDRLNGTWEDMSLIQAYTNYYLSAQGGKQDICYLTGKMSTISENHPKGIMASDYGAKLISANDSQGYTFRGHFHNAGQAYALSYEASQKIHSSLTWLAKNQGTYIGTQDKRMFICWNPKGKGTPDIVDPFGLIDDEEDSYAGPDYRKKLRKVFAGYQESFEDADSVIIMAFDAATTGRLSITYYQELLASEFFRRIVSWGETCNWWFLKFNEQKKPYNKVETPTFRKIVECAFGRERKGMIEVDDKLLKEQTQRLVKGMIEGQNVPQNLVRALADRASVPLAYSGTNRERVLSTACAIIAKYYCEKQKEMKGETDYMILDLENSDRSYLFGRLLAIYEKIERSTYDSGESRETNAIRLQAAYVNYPMQVWKTLESAVNPYFQKLSPGLREYYRNMISEIAVQLSLCDERERNQRLKETYLLGYYLQRKELNSKKTEKKEETDNE